MGKKALRVIQIVLAAVGGLLIVPVAVNVGTGAKPPSWLEPVVGWLWPAALVCVVLVIALQVWDTLAGSSEAISARRPNDPRNATLALAQVSKYVETRLQASLPERARIALALDERPTAVRQPAHLVQRISGKEFQLADGLGIVDVFEDMSESMLILGAPGAGKTTQLLELASALITRIRAEERGAETPIPVVVDLADWSRSGIRRFVIIGSADRGPQDFTEWLLATLRSRYGIPKLVGQTWLNDDRIVPLLDGLDEVREEHRDRCVEEVNALNKSHGVSRVAVCSRIADYDLISARLNLQGAVVIRPLTEEQILAFFSALGPRMSGVVAELHADPQLRELLTSPLMLNIMALAYGDGVHEAAPAADDLADRRRRLFDTYVTEVLARRQSHGQDDNERALRSIRTLAVASTKLNAGVRVVPLNVDTFQEAVDANVHDTGRAWLSRPGAAVSCLVVAAAMSIHFSAAAGVVAGLLPWLAGLLVISLFAIITTSEGTFGRALIGGSADAINGIGWLIVVAWLLIVASSVAALAIALRWLALLLADEPRAVAAGVTLAIAGAEALFVRWSYHSMDDEAWAGTYIWIGGGGLVLAVLVLLFGLSAQVLTGWAIGVATVFGVLFCLLSSAGPTRADKATSRFVLTREILYTIAIVVLPLLLANSWATPFWLPITGWLIGIFTGLLPSWFASALCSGAYIRLVMAMTGDPIPWRRSLLRFAIDRTLLDWVDGEYRFIHLLVRDYLATCEPDRLAHIVELRRAEMTASPPTAHRT